MSREFGGFKFGCLAYSCKTVRTRILLWNGLGSQLSDLMFDGAVTEFLRAAVTASLVAKQTVTIHRSAWRLDGRMPRAWLTGVK